MNDILNALFVIVLILNLFALGSSRIHSVIKIIAAQGILLGLFPLLVHPVITLPEIVSSLSAVSLKGFIIPAMMIKAMRDVKIKKEVEPLLGLLLSTILGALVTGAAFLVFANTAPSANNGVSLLIPTSISTIIAGFIMLTTRVKALSQVLGYLLLENGI